jgi:hypothetical protein
MKAEQNPIKRAIRKPTYLNAIKAKCAECMGCTENHLEEGFRDDIASCTSWTCPLRPFRPYQKRQEGGASEPESFSEAKGCQYPAPPPKRAEKILAVGGRRGEK